MTLGFVMVVRFAPDQQGANSVWVSGKYCGSGFRREQLGESMMSRLVAKCAWSLPKLHSVWTKAQEKAKVLRFYLLIGTWTLLWYHRTTISWPGTRFSQCDYGGLIIFVENADEVENNPTASLAGKSVSTQSGGFPMPTLITVHMNHNDCRLSWGIVVSYTPVASYLWLPSINYKTARTARETDVVLYSSRVAPEIMETRREETGCIKV